MGKVTWSFARKRELEHALCEVMSKKEGCVPPFIRLERLLSQARNN